MSELEIRALHLKEKEENRYRYSLGLWVIPHIKEAYTLL